MKTRCSKCRKLIDYGNTYCVECSSNVLKERKKNIKNAQIEATTKSARWKATRRKVLQRDKCCVLCWHRDNFVEMRGLEVHHIVKRVDDPTLIYELSNLVTLCKFHHEEMEKLSPVKQKKLLQGYINEINYSIL